MPHLVPHPPLLSAWSQATSPRRYPHTPATWPLAQNINFSNVWLFRPAQETVWLFRMAEHMALAAAFAAWYREGMLDLGSIRTVGRAAKPLEASVVREHVPEDLVL